MPQVITPTEGPRRRIIVVGAGPAGLEAGRVAAARGHYVHIFEAASNAGGQVRLAAQSRRRSELIGIVDWRQTQLEAAGADQLQYLRRSSRHSGGRA